MYGSGIDRLVVFLLLAGIAIGGILFVVVPWAWVSHPHVLAAAAGMVVAFGFGYAFARIR
jgi:hypothetical protein